LASHGSPTGDWKVKEKRLAVAATLNSCTACGRLCVEHEICMTLQRLSSFGLQEQSFQVYLLLLFFFFLNGVLLFYSALGQFMMVFVSPLGFLLWSHGGCRESGTDVGL